MWSGCASGSMQIARCGTGCLFWSSSASSRAFAALILWRTCRFILMRSWRSGLRGNNAAHPRGDLERVGREVRGPIEQLLRLVVPGFDGRGRPHRRAPFTDVAPGFFEYLATERGLRPVSIDAYRHHLDRFEDYLSANRGQGADGGVADGACRVRRRTPRGWAGQDDGSADLRGAAGVPALRAPRRRARAGTSVTRCSGRRSTGCPMSRGRFRGPRWSGCSPVWIAEPPAGNGITRSCCCWSARSTGP